MPSSFLIFYKKVLQSEASKILAESERLQQQRRKRVVASSTSGSNLNASSLNSTTLRPRSASAPQAQAKVLTAKHGMQLSNRVVRFHTDPLLAIVHLNKRIKRTANPK